MRQRDLTTTKLAITYCQLDDLKPDPCNPRAHSRTQIRQIARSIESFGFNVPVLVDADMQVVAGHGRLAACQHLGWSEVPTIRLDHLDEAQRRAFMIADNRLNETSSWDERLLAEQLKDLSILDLDFAIEATGFDMGEIDLRIASLEVDPKSAARAEEPIESIPTGLAVSQLGDLWLLDRHRVLCGSAIAPEDFATLMSGEAAAAVFTDPPYNVPIKGHVIARGGRHREFAMASGEMDEEAFQAFLVQSMTLLAKHARAGSLHYICMDWRHAGAMIAAGTQAFHDLVNLCVWTKPNAGMGSFYRELYTCLTQPGRWARFSASAERPYDQAFRQPVRPHGRFP